MSVSVELEGVEYTLPASGDTDWAAQLTTFLQAIPTAIDANAGVNVVAGAGLTLTGDTLAVVAADSTLTVNADSIQLAAAYKTKIDGQYTYVAGGSTAAQLQAAIDGLSGSGTVLLGNGTIALGTTTININGNIRLVGHGQSATVLTSTNTTGTAIQINSGAGVETLRAGLSQLTLDGLGVAKYGISLGQGTTSPLTGAGVFEDITVKGFAAASGCGVRFVFTALCLWIHCTFQENTNGLHSAFLYANGATTQTFISCRFILNTKRGCHIEQFDTFNFLTCQFEDNGEEGLLVKHPGGGVVVTRLMTLDNCYFEDNNSTAGGFNDCRFDAASTQSLVDCAIRRTRFQGTNSNLWFGHGNFLEEDNQFSPIATTNVTASTDVCYLTTRNSLDPATYITAASTSPTVHWRMGGDGTFRLYINVSGTLTERMRANSSGMTYPGNASFGHTQTPAYPVDLGTANANTKFAIYNGGTGLENALVGFGLASGDFRSHLNSTAAKFSWRATASGSSLMELAGTGPLTLGGVAVPTISSSDTLTNKTLTAPVINAATISGVFAGTAKFSGNNSFGHSSAANYPIDMGSGNANTKIAIYGGGASEAAVCGIGLGDGDLRFHLNTASGTKFSWRATASGSSIMELSGGGALTLGGVAIPTISSSDTLTNKTLTAPVINAATISGTFAGTAKFSGNNSFGHTSTANYAIDCGPSNANTKIAIYGGGSSEGAVCGIGLADGDLRFHMNTASGTKFSWRPTASGASIMELSGAGALTVNGVAALTQTNTVTGITNKTFTAPTINAATISGTFSGSAKFSGANSFGHNAAPGSNVPYISLGSGLDNCKLALYDSASGADSGIAGFGLQSGDVRFFLNATGSKWSWRGTASGSSVMELNGTGQLSLLGTPTVYKGTTSITAFATGGQASATALTAEVNFVTTVASANDSVKLPTPSLGMRVVVFNTAANSLNIFPVTGGAIDALATNAAYALAGGGSREFWGQSGTAWKSK